MSDRGADVPAVFSLRDVADLTGERLRTVRSWRTRWPEWPDPVGRVPSPMNHRIRQEVFDAEAVRQCLADHEELVRTRNMWSAEQVAAELQLDLRDVLGAERDGLLPKPDGYRGDQAVWRPERARAWSQGRIVPPGSWTARQVTRYTGHSLEHCIRVGLTPDGFTPGASRRVGTRWWWPDTVAARWAAVQDAQLEAEERRQQAAAAELAAKSEPRWFSQDVAECTGLSWETVRTYRRKGKMPDPDGFDGTRPWWRPETIMRWDKPKITGRPRVRAPQPPTSADYNPPDC